MLNNRFNKTSNVRKYIAHSVTKSDIPAMCHILTYIIWHLMSSVINANYSTDIRCNKRTCTFMAFDIRMHRQLRCPSAYIGCLTRIYRSCIMLSVRRIIDWSVNGSLQHLRMINIFVWYYSHWLTSAMINNKLIVRQFNCGQSHRIASSTQTISESWLTFLRLRQREVELELVENGE